MHTCQPFDALSESRIGMIEIHARYRLGVKEARLTVVVLVCSKYLTYNGGCIIGSLMTTPAKRKALLAPGTLNPHPEAVRSELFPTDFFDPTTSRRLNTRCCAPTRSMKTPWPRF